MPATTRRRRRLAPTPAVEALQLALDAAHARAGAERLAGVDGVLGTLLDLVEIDDGWEQAVEAALGEALTAVVVDGDASARRALAALARVGHQWRRAGDRDARALRRHPPQVGSPVRAHVRSGRPGLSGLLDALIGGAVRVDGVEAAVDAAIAHPSSVIVTAGGDRLAPTGWRVGAAVGRRDCGRARGCPPSGDSVGDGTRSRRARTRRQSRRARPVSVSTSTRSNAGSTRTTPASPLPPRGSPGCSDNAASCRPSSRASTAPPRIWRPTSPSSGSGSPSSTRRCRRSRPTSRPRPTPSAARGEAAGRLRGPRRGARVAPPRHSRSATPACTSGTQFLEQRIAETERRLEADAEARAARAAERRHEVERSLDRHRPSWPSSSTAHRGVIEVEHEAAARAAPPAERRGAGA